MKTTDIKTLSATDHSQLLSHWAMGHTEVVCEKLGIPFGSIYDPEWLDMYTKAIHDVVWKRASY